MFTEYFVEDFMFLQHVIGYVHGKILNYGRESEYTLEDNGHIVEIWK